MTNKYFKTPSRFMSVENIAGVEFCVDIDVVDLTITRIQFNMAKSMLMVPCSKEEVDEAFDMVTNKLKTLI